MSAAKTKPSNGKPMQQHLPTMEPKRIPDVERLAEKFITAREEKGVKINEFNAAADLLWAKMTEHKIKAYEMPDGRTVEIKAKDVISLKRKKKDKAKKEPADA